MTREETIKWQEAFKRTYGNFPPEATEACDMAIEALKEPERKWIPVSERLPETEDKVMCCTETKKGDKNIVIGYYMEGAWRCGMNSNVIAWQPLPEPYKAGEHHD